MTTPVVSDIDDSWNVDKFKSEHEMDHEWDLRKKFLIAHKDTYDEDRLVSLAQIFCNVYFLGCRYAEPIMELIDSLSKEITEKNEKWECQSFKSASAAVEEKVKARIGSGEQQTLPPAKRPIKFVQSEDLSASGSGEPYTSSQLSNLSENDEKINSNIWVRGQKRSSSSGLGYEENKDEDDEINRQPNKKPRSESNETSGGETVFSFEHKRKLFDVRHVVESGPFGKVVVFQSAVATEESPISIIERTASAAHMTTSYDFNPNQNGVICKLSLDGLYLATGTGRSMKVAKETACKVAIDRLKETSFTIMVKAPFVGSESVDHELSGEKKETKDATNLDTPIADTNIGSKMLKLMGWTGGGLGKNEQGIEEPVKPYDCNVRRGGLGISNFTDFRRKVIRIVEDFAHSNAKDDLVFSPEFNKDERKLIHELVGRYNLKSRSFGKDDNRRLVVFKRIRPLEIVEELISCGGETEKYKLVSPLAPSS